MLKVKIVSTRVRTAGWCRTQPEALGDVVAHPATDCRARRWCGQHQPGDQQRAGGHEARLGEERPGHRRPRTGRPDRRTDQLVDRDEAGLEPGVGDRQVLARDQHRQQRARRVVGEHLGGRRAGRARPAPPAPRPVGDDRQGEQHQDHRPDQVDDDHDQAAVEPVRQGPGAPGRRAAAAATAAAPPARPGTGRGSGRPPAAARGQRDPVAEVAQPRRGQQPAEAVAQPAGDERLDQAAHKVRRLRPPPERRQVVFARWRRRMTRVSAIAPPTRPSAPRRPRPGRPPSVRGTADAAARAPMPSPGTSTA